MTRSDLGIVHISTARTMSTSRQHKDRSLDSGFTRNMNFRNTCHLWFWFLGLLLLPLVLPISGTNTLSANDILSVASNRTIGNEVLELGFFSLTSERWYLGIWYRGIPERSYVWIANRNNPLLNSGGTLKFSNSNLVLLGDDKSEIPMWSTENSLHSQSSLVVAELLDNGNFVIRDLVNNNPEEFLWQSFDYPTDTLLPGMKLGWDHKKNITRELASWKDIDDPTSGKFSYRIETDLVPHTYLEDKSDMLTAYRVWNVGTHQVFNNLVVNFIATKEEIACSIRITEAKAYARLRLNVVGTLFLLTRPLTSAKWTVTWTFPNTSYPTLTEDKNTNNGKIIGPVVGTTVLLIICAAVAFYYWRKRTNNESSVGGLELLPLGAEQEFNLPQIGFPEIVNATENFSVANKLGQGGFGAVYKGTLRDGTKIAAKRLTRMTMEGTNQFRNEVNLIAKLQHINLVRVLGYCIDSQEGFLLIYEYMENLSLDSHLFGNSTNPPLSWQSRYNIAKGIARGMQYLHQDSHFRIIHRDLKVSNILLDHNMVPKISDFGLARLIKRDENELNTVAVVGTMGYMAPEYTRDGTFSAMSDVYSFGILLLEIICGQKNWGYTNKNGDAGLINCVWKSWKDNNFHEVVDPHVTVSQQVIRALQIGLLCTQERAQYRPEMYIVVLMLESEEPIPNPLEPTAYTTYDIGSTSSSASASDSTISWSRWAAKVGVAAPPR